MKRGVDITLSTIHLGQCRRVVTLGIDGTDNAQSFLNKLSRDDYRQVRALYARIQAVSNHDSYENRTTFRHVDEGIFEFKRPGLRLYAFYDQLGDEEQLILCTNGGKKNTRKQQTQDIKRAINLKRRFESAKSNPESTISILK